MVAGCLCHQIYSPAKHFKPIINTHISASLVHKGNRYAWVKRSFSKLIGLPLVQVFPTKDIFHFGLTLMTPHRLDKGKLNLLYEVNAHV